MPDFSPLPALAVGLSLVAGAANANANLDPPTPKPTQTTTQCTDGKIWDAEKEACVDARDSSLTDDQRFDAAQELADAGRYGDALTVLAAATAPNTPRILNLTGFAHRKAGRLDQGMAYYRRALAIDPDYLPARSYMGQGLAESGDIAGAKAQLIEIRNRGGRDTWAYTSLKLALQGKSTY